MAIMSRRQECVWPSAHSMVKESLEPETEVTSQSVNILTPTLLASLTRASTTSEALCETGNARSPLSVTVSRPEAFRKAMRACGVRFWKAGRRKFDLLRMCSENSFQGFTFVKLQRPLPVIITFLAGRGIFSSRVTCAGFPASTRVFAAPYAAIRPDAPPPITTTSDFIND